MPDFRCLFESSPGAYLVLDPDLRIVAVTDAYLAATMTNRAEIVGRGLFEVFPDNPDDLQATGEANLRASLDRVRHDLRADTMAVQKYDIRRPEAEGGQFEVRYWSPLNSPVLGAGGRLAYIIHGVEDVTEFVRLQQAGAKQQQVTSELQQRTTQMAAEIRQRSTELADANRRLQDAAIREATARIEARAHRDRLTAQAERERLEAQLHQSQRLESLGQLAGGVAHDFNNLIGAILNYASFVAEEVTAAAGLPGGERWRPVGRDVEQIRRAAERGANLTHQLLAFGRREIVQPRVLTLNDVAADVEQLLRRTLGEHIKLTAQLAVDLWPVVADAGQIEQVLVNLAVNARDAMPGGGTLTIETANVVIDDAGSHPGLSSGRYVRLRVSDTGTGIPEHLQQRVFEPFFTTKPTGEGTGLGLATVYGIVTQAGGHPQIASTPGQGTSFTVLLPAANQPATRPHRPTARHHTPGGETILLVEDEEALLEVTRRILTRNGYLVITAANGTEAVDLAQREEQEIHLLITDVIMPGMLGKDVADRMRTNRPGIRTLFISGYAHPVLASRGSLEPGVDLLDKPFTEGSLLGSVRAVLDRR